MTNDEKEIFLSKALRNEKYLSSAYYYVRWILYLDTNTGITTLYEDTEYENSHSVDFYSRDTNYALTTVNDTNNGSKPWVKHFDVSFLFYDDFKSYFGCMKFNNDTPIKHNVSITKTISTRDEEEWTLLHNGVANSDYIIDRTSISPNEYFVTSFSMTRKSFSSLGSAQNALINDFINQGYPTNNVNELAPYQNWLQNSYVPCIMEKSNKCCLEYC